MIVGPRGATVFVSCIVLVVVAAIPIGRWERDRADSSQRRTLERIYHLITGVNSPRLTALRLSSAYDCLLYRSGPNPYAIELCFDGSGRLVQAIDRRDEHSIKVGDVTNEPGLAPIAVDPHRIARILHRYKPIPGVQIGSVPPIGFNDNGPQLLSRR